MAATALYAINSEGSVYSLQTNKSAWQELPYLGLEFKKVSAVPQFMWGIGGDRQIYVYVHGLDMPIRVKEEAYENERWLPFEGFSNKLLPTDRYNYSNADGSIECSLHKIRLPTLAWQWDGDWHLDLDFDGQRLAEDGWMYAIDFPASYSAEKSWNSYVRRRRWIRFRRYNAINSWCAVLPLFKDPTQEPFMDVAIGGTNVPNADNGIMLVWAITAHGRAMFRTGVTTTSPEGSRWIAINAPTPCEFKQISVGPTGLVWAVLCNGRVLVRAGVTRTNLAGSAWLDVKPPCDSATNDTLKLLQVSVGTHAVWGVTSNHHVWCRRGINGETSGTCEDAAIGTGWVEMVGNISMVSLAANDQVFAVGAADRAIYFRSGVSASNPTGKHWLQINCALQMSCTSSSTSTLSCCSHNGSSSKMSSKQPSFTNLYNAKKKGVVETVAIIETVLRHASLKCRASSSAKCKQLHARSPTRAGSLNLNELHMKRQPCSSLPCSAPAAEGFALGTEASSEENCSTRQASYDGFMSEHDDHIGSQYWAEYDILWDAVVAGAVIVEAGNTPAWFNEPLSDDFSADISANFRQHVVRQLQEKAQQLAALEQREKYEKPVELSSWIKCAEARYQRHSGDFEHCLINLEWVNNRAATSETRDVDSGTFTVLNPEGVTARMQFSLSDITCVQCCSEPTAPRLAIHTLSLPGYISPVRLQFATDVEMEDWLSHLSSVCSQINDVYDKPSSNAIWSTTDLGEIFVFDPAHTKRRQYQEELDCYVYENDLRAMETPYYNTLCQGLPRGAELEVTGCVYDDADQIRFDLQCHSNIKTVANRSEKLRVIALHLNPRFHERCTILNSMQDSEWQEELRNDHLMFAPGATFKLKIQALTSQFRIWINDVQFADFLYRTDPEAINCLYVSGRIKIFNVINRSPSIIVPMQQMYWRQMGGHLRRVYSCKGGVVWGISCDNTLWCYTGGWGGNFLKGLGNSSGKIQTMIDTHIYYVYENQRWNPISGFTSKSLPTDRHMWSDASGRQKRSKEHSKLFSRHNEWISDWMVDYNMIGGTDKEGWQYAIDFPASYHAQKKLTDCVRRRRWMKKSRLTSSGPWQEVSRTQILDVSLQMVDMREVFESSETEVNSNMFIAAWAVALNGDVLVREQVTASNPVGESWEHIASETPFLSISICPDGEVWTVSRNGMIYYRVGVTLENPLGVSWQGLDNPAGVSFKCISAGRAGVWALDTQNRLAVRRDISNKVPKGSYWQILPNVANIAPHTDTQVGFKAISVGGEVWAVALSGFMCKRCGITKENPAGVGWNFGIPAQWQHVSVEAYP